MIIQYKLNSKLSKLRNSNTEKFNNRLKNAIKHVYPSMLFKISRDDDSQIIIEDVPIIYVNSIKNTLEHIFENIDFDSESSSSENDDSLIKLMFKSFGIENLDDRESFLNQILNIRIEYKEDLFFYSNTLIQDKPRLKMLYGNDNRYFYKINYNSKLHTNSSLKLFNNIIQANSQSKEISIINNPSTLFKFQFKLETDLNILTKIIKVYRKSDILKYLSEEDILKYEKYFKYITFLDNKNRTRELENKKDIHKEIQNAKDKMYEQITHDQQITHQSPRGTRQQSQQAQKAQQAKRGQQTQQRREINQTENDDEDKEKLLKYIRGRNNSQNDRLDEYTMNKLLNIVKSQDFKNKESSNLGQFGTKTSNVEKTIQNQGLTELFNKYKIGPFSRSSKQTQSSRHQRPKQKQKGGDISIFSPSVTIKQYKKWLEEHPLRSPDNVKAEKDKKGKADNIIRWYNKKSKLIFFHDQKGKDRHLGIHLKKLYNFDELLITLLIREGDYLNLPMELGHDFIQVLFPTPTKSRFANYIATMDKSNLYRLPWYNVKDSLRIMKNYYWFLDNWIKPPPSHNLLRISRIIECFIEMCHSWEDEIQRTNSDDYRPLQQVQSMFLLFYNRIIKCIEKKKENRKLTTADYNTINTNTITPYWKDQLDNSKFFVKCNESNCNFYTYKDMLSPMCKKHMGIVDRCPYCSKEIPEVHDGILGEDFIYCNKDCLAKSREEGWINGEPPSESVDDTMCVVCHIRKRNTLQSGGGLQQKGGDTSFFCSNYCKNQARKSKWNLKRGEPPKKIVRLKRENPPSTKQNKKADSLCIQCKEKPKHRQDSNPNLFYDFCSQSCARKYMMRDKSVSIKCPICKIRPLCAKPGSQNQFYDYCSNTCKNKALTPPSIQTQTIPTPASSYQKTMPLTGGERLSDVYTQTPYKKYDGAPQYDKAIMFYNKTDNTYFLTNFGDVCNFTSTIKFADGHSEPINFKTAEHYFQAYKMYYFHNLFKHVATLGRPIDAFEFMRKTEYKQYQDTNWHRRESNNIPRKVNVMLEALRSKFNSPSYKQMLLDTKDYYLIENARENDAYWGNGCGNCSECKAKGRNDPPLSTCAKEHKHNNILGKLLMHVRQELITGQPISLEIVDGYMEFK